MMHAKVLKDYLRGAELWKIHKWKKININLEISLKK